MKAIFFGTPKIAAVILKQLIQAKIEIVAVVTQPDKPKGRGKEVAVSEVKEVALSFGLPIYQPQKVKEESFIQQLKEKNPDIILVAAYGKILPSSILTLPHYGCLNVHASLLPKYRGASPIQWAILNGEKVSGVTIMYMDEGLDTGDILLKKEILLDSKETAQSLHDKLADLGGKALLEVLVSIEKGEAKRIPQSKDGVVYVGTIEKSFGWIDFNRSAIELERFVRGLNPWPSAYTKWNGKSLKFWDTDFVFSKDFPSLYKDSPNGTVVFIDKEHFWVQCGEGFLQVNELQLEGKRRMCCEEFLRGYSLTVGTKLGE
mgnify:CR=1 FL=1